MLVDRHGSELVERRVLRRTQHDDWNGIVIRATHASERNAHRSLWQLDIETVNVAPDSADLDTWNAGSGRDRDDSLRCRAREHDSSLALTEEDSSGRNLRPAREIDFSAALGLEVGDTAFRERNGKATVAAIVC
jgi:hypothetical protein